MELFVKVSDTVSEYYEFQIHDLQEVEVDQAVVKKFFLIQLRQIVEVDSTSSPCEKTHLDAIVQLTICVSVMVAFSGTPNSP